MCYCRFTTRQRSSRVKRYSAIKGYRTCLVAKENATDDNLDIANISRYHHITNTQFKEVLAVSSFEQQHITKKYGLRDSIPILDQLQRERHLQSSQDIYHLMVGKALKFLKLTIAILSQNGECRFLRN